MNKNTFLKRIEIIEELVLELDDSLYRSTNEPFRKLLHDYKYQKRLWYSHDLKTIRDTIKIIKKKINPHP